MGAEASQLTKRGDADGGGAHGEDATRVRLAQISHRETGEVEEQVLTAYMTAVRSR